MRVEFTALETTSAPMVMEKMVEAAVQAVRQYTRDTLFIDEHRELVRTALKAALEATPPAPKATEAPRHWATVRVVDTGDGLIIHTEDARELGLQPDKHYQGHFLPDGRYRLDLTELGAE